MILLDGRTCYFEMWQKNTTICSISVEYVYHELNAIHVLYSCYNHKIFSKSIWIHLALSWAYHTWILQVWDRCTSFLHSWYLPYLSYPTPLGFSVGGKAYGAAGPLNKRTSKPHPGGWSSEKNSWPGTRKPDSIQTQKEVWIFQGPTRRIRVCGICLHLYTINKSTKCKICK